ncbi:unnamed protein product, partial [Notodromas monacha]
MARQNIYILSCVVLVLAYFFAIRVGFSIKCYECNSFTDPRCADPFDNRSFPQTDCKHKRMDHLGDKEPESCRKTRQKVDGQWRFIRSCAFVDNPGLDGDERYCRILEGTFNIHVEHCECKGKEGCNAAHSLSPSPTVNLIPFIWAGLFCAAALPAIRHRFSDGIRKEEEEVRFFPCLLVGGSKGAECEFSGSREMSGERGVVPENANLYVKLNVSGALHYTTIGTLTKRGGWLRDIFSGRSEVLTDSDGWILINRSGKHFGTILNFLRDDSVELPSSREDIEELCGEAKFYEIPEIVHACEAALQKFEKNAWKSKGVLPICTVSLITTSEEAQALISSTTKPVVKLLVNRHNNKYSYTSNSDDNLLKNIELFDKLCRRFFGRIVFIKDVMGTNEICCWTFYGRGRKFAEVSCTSIVYATDKKHTKVRCTGVRCCTNTYTRP